MIKIDKSEKIARSKYFIRSHVKFVEKSHLARLSGGTAGPIRGSFSKLSTRARFSMELLEKVRQEVELGIVMRL